MIKKNYEDLKVGDKSFFQKTISEVDVFVFAGICGDFNPLHVSETYAQGTRFKKRIAHGMLTASLIDYTITDLLGLGGVHISQNIQFKAPVGMGDTITVESTIVNLEPERRRLRIASTLTNQEGTVIITGEAEAMLLK